MCTLVVPYVYVGPESSVYKNNGEGAGELRKESDDVTPIFLGKFFFLYHIHKNINQKARKKKAPGPLKFRVEYHLADPVPPLSVYSPLFDCECNTLGTGVRV